MDNLIDQIAAGIVFGGALLMWFAASVRASAKAENFTDLSFMENMGIVVPMLFVAYSFWRFS